jgi:hypothetical protein
MPFIPISLCFERITLQAHQSTGKGVCPQGSQYHRFVKHALPSRIESAKALSDFLRDIEGLGMKARASTYLARLFGGTVNADARGPTGSGSGLIHHTSSTGPAAWNDWQNPLASS